VRPGTTVAAARARAADVHSVEESPPRLAEARREVVGRLLVVSPRIAADGPTRFWVEPVARRLGALHRWCEDARAALVGLGPASIGVGATATVAWAAACRATGGHLIVPAAESQRFLDEQPLELLEIDGEALDVLAALGVRRMGELRLFDPASLGMRFGPEVAAARRRLDGLDARRPTTPRVEREDEVQVELDDELDDAAALAFLLAPAAERLTSGLRAKGRGAVRTTLLLELRGRREHALEVRTASPIAEARALIELLRTALEGVRLVAPIASFRLAASTTAPLPSPGDTLFGGPGRDRAAGEIALARLRARFGDDAVRRARRNEVGDPRERARWASGEDAATSGDGSPLLPWRFIEPVRVERGFAYVAGRCRRLARIGKVERVTAPWWEDGRRRVALWAWAEMDGPLLVMLRAVCDTSCDDTWEVVAWVD